MIELGVRVGFPSTLRGFSAGDHSAGTVKRFRPQFQVNNLQNVGATSRTRVFNAQRQSEEA